MIEKIQNKKTVKYRAIFYLNGSRFTSPRFPTEAEAVAWEARKRTEVADNQVVTGSEMTVFAFAKMWLDKYAFVFKTRGAALRDEQCLRLHVMPYLGDKRLRNVTRQDIQLMVSSWLQGKNVSHKTVNNMLGTAKKMFSEAVAWGFLSALPATHVKRIKVQQREVSILYPEEISRILSWSADRDPMLHDVCVFALNTGMRLGEICALSWSRVDLRRRYVTVDCTWDRYEAGAVNRTKGKRFRKVPLNPTAYQAIAAHALLPHSETDLVFAVNYEHMKKFVFKRCLRLSGCQDALVRKVTFHCLRHTFASEFMRNGGDIYRLQKILGHSTVAQTEQYSHFSPDFLAGETDRVAFATPKGTVIPLPIRG